MSPGRGEGRRLATGSLAQQASQVTGLVTIFAIITVLARELSLAELGVYGLLISLLGYLLIVQNAGAGATVRTLAASEDRARAERVFSTAVALYAAMGTATGLLIFGVGLALDPILGLDSGLARDVRLGALLLAAATVLGWPLTAYRDALRAEGLLVRAALAEIVSLVFYAALVLGLALSGADLALVIGASGTIPLLAGLACIVAARGVRHRLRLGLVGRGEARELLGLAGYVSLTEVAAAGIYAADRLILGAFTSAGAVALFEGPVRAHNLVRSLSSALTVSVLPAASRYHAEGDERRLQELLIRGMRYSLALMTPLAVVGMVLAPPLLDVWLGDRFREGGTAMAILMAHWLLNGASGVLAAVLIATGRARGLAAYAGLLAAANVALALALAPWLELEGVAIATTVPYLLLFPLLLQRALAAVPVPLSALIGRAFAPALGPGAILAAGLGGLRIALSPETLPSVGGLALAGLFAYWLAFYALLMDRGERELTRALIGR